MKCRICGCEESRLLFRRRVMNAHEAEYYRCPNCDAVFTQPPYWLEEAHQKEDGVSAYDVGALIRNVRFARKTNAVLRALKLTGKTYLDFGAGFGLFVRYMRDAGFRFLWYDLYAPNLLARGFEYGGSEPIAAVTSLEVFEHLSEPLPVFERMQSIARTLIVSTELHDGGEAVESGSWNYYQFETGQHVTFYSETTMRYLAEKFGLRYVRLNNGFHLFTDRAVSAPLIKLLSRDKLCALLYANMQKYCFVEEDAAEIRRILGNKGA